MSYQRWIAAVVAVGLFVFWKWWTARGVTKVNSDDLEAILGKQPGQLTVVDVREPVEYRGGHISIAENIPLGQLRRKLGTLPKDKSVVFVCQSGSRSMIAARQAKRFGFPNIYNLSGGMYRWRGPVKR